LSSSVTPTLKMRWYGLHERKPTKPVGSLPVWTFQRMGVTAIGSESRRCRAPNLWSPVTVLPLPHPLVRLAVSRLSHKLNRIASQPSQRQPKVELLQNCKSDGGQKAGFFRAHRGVCAWINVRRERETVRRCRRRAREVYRGFAEPVGRWRLSPPAVVEERDFPRAGFRAIARRE